MMDLSIVVPAYNEKNRIGITLTKISSFLNDFDPEYEIIVSDDGSTDNTSEVVETIAKNNDRVFLVKNLHKGKGFAVKSGVMRSNGRFVLLCDADLATPIDELKRLMVWVKDNNFDVAIASREGIGSTRKNEPLRRHIMGRVFNFIIKLLVLPGINDTQCGFKLFKGQVAKEVFSKARLYSDSSKELKVPKVTAYDVEILYIAKKLGYMIKEVPVTWEYVKTTRVSTVRDSFANLLDVLKVKFNSIKGLY